jgi:hypothetical protein
LADNDNPRLDVSAQQSFWLIYPEHSLQQGARAHQAGCESQIQQEMVALADEVIE